MKVDQLSQSIINNSQKLSQLNETLDNEKMNFGDMLMSKLENVSSDQLNAEEMDRLFAIGEVDNIHDVTIAAMKADLSLNLAVEVTNKVLSAYSEIMRLQL